MGVHGDQLDPNWTDILTHHSLTGGSHISPPPLYFIPESSQSKADDNYRAPPVQVGLMHYQFWSTVSIQRYPMTLGLQTTYAKLIFDKPKKKLYNSIERTK